MKIEIKTSPAPLIGPGTLFLLFLVLRLTHEIDWSWWWVAALLWVPIALFAAFGVGFLVFLLVAAIAIRIADR